MEPAVIRHQQIATLPIDKLRPNPRNTRTHSKKQIRQLANSIARFGWTYPILVDENSVILAGHARYSAAQLLGCRKVPVIVVTGLSDPEKRALALADNKIAANAGWDRKLLAEELGELATLLPECDLDLNITGFEPAEIDSLLGDLADPEQDPADEVPALEKEAISRIGDLWELGPHRLLCGDAQSAAAYRLLMGGVSAAMVFTDPPYNVPIKSVQGRGRIKHREFRARLRRNVAGTVHPLLALFSVPRRKALGGRRHPFRVYRLAARRRPACGGGSRLF